jgi:hypothetical protein
MIKYFTLTFSSFYAKFLMLSNTEVPPSGEDISI